MAWGPTALAKLDAVDVRVPAAAEAWARQNQCIGSAGPGFVADRRAAGPDAGGTEIRFGGCAHGANVSLYLVNGGGHEWHERPSVASVSDPPDYPDSTTARILALFEERAT